MFNVNLYMRVDLTEEDRIRLYEVKETLMELRESIKRCSDMADYQIDPCLMDTVHLLAGILEGDVLG